MKVKKPLNIVEFEAFDLDTGTTQIITDSVQEVLVLAQDYRANPSIVFIGIDKSGYQARTWTINEVLSGTFEKDLDS